MNRDLLLEDATRNRVRLLERLIVEYDVAVRCYNRMESAIQSEWADARDRLNRAEVALQKEARAIRRLRRRPRPANVRTRKGAARG